MIARVAQVLLGLFLTTAGVLHLTTQRQEFQNQVPPWIPLDEDLVVVASGLVEIGLGAALLTVWRQPWRARLGLTVALFFLAVFPGNIAQYVEGRDAFGLDTDTKRLIRLPFQPLLMLWPWLSTRDRSPS